MIALIVYLFGIGIAHGIAQAEDETDIRSLIYAIIWPILIISITSNYLYIRWTTKKQ